MSSASQLGTVDDIYNLIQIFGILMYFTIPLLVVFLIIYITHRTKTKAKNKKNINKQHKKQQKKLKKQREEEIKQANELFKDGNKMMHHLDNIQEPIQKIKYKNLELTFGDDGKIINN